MKDLTQVLADAREESWMLEANEAKFTPARVRAILDDFEAAASEYMTWISESEAIIRSGHKAPWFRQMFPLWEQMKHARWNPRRPKERQYRVLIVPLARDDDGIRADARRAAQESPSQEMAS